MDTLDPLQELEAEYSPQEKRPLGSYAAITAAHVGMVGVAIAVAARKGRLPERLGPADLALGAVATFKLSRLISRGTVTSPLRAPFTEYAGPSDQPAELDEEVRGSGWRHAIGELLTCPFCISHWISTAYCLGLCSAPRATRTVASILAVDAGADALQFANAKLSED